MQIYADSKAGGQCSLIIRYGRKAAAISLRTLAVDERILIVLGDGLLCKV